MGRFLSVDPLMDMEPGQSPYAYVSNNPVKYTDPTGMHKETTIVGDNEDGTYTVIRVIKDGKTDVTLEDGTKIGNSVTPYPFVLDNGSAVVGAIIDMGSREGQDFLNGLYKDDPSTYKYVTNAKKKEQYDFKIQCMDPSGTGDENKRHRYRGSVLDNGLIASARDVGNIGAGYVAGRQGLGWPLFRFAANTLETSQKNNSSIPAAVFGYHAKVIPGSPLPGIIHGFDRHQEGAPTQSAQRYGFDLGNQAREVFNSKRYY